ncbi:metaxin-1a isoform X1 [Nothobranchius furzeri]|uniref:metaxin-1a isoform X1 n=1 Tax=Nothobranchius furzeri TaxID=105023 RepID=UPI0024045F9F|nr:metaxin-1a isoform X1 [Nothobranchius furzeri]
MAAPDELFCWEGDWGLPSVSTDCLVVLAYAQFAGAPLKLRKICNPWRSPSGSLPALKTNQKETLSRPADIIIHLRKQKFNADYDLSAKEGADSLAFISLMEEKLTPALVTRFVLVKHEVIFLKLLLILRFELLQIYTFWVEPKNYVDVTRRWYAEHMTFPLNFFLPGRMQSRQLEKLRLLRGDESLEAGEELEKELYCDAAECMNLLSQRLGSQKFFFGDSPSSLDAYVFGHLAPILKCKLPNGKLQQHLKSLDNLTNFCSDILLLYFPRDGRESSGPKAPPQPDGGDFDNVPNKRRKQLLSALVALGAMLSYALLTGMVSILHVQQGALEEPPDLEPIESHQHEEQGGS